MGLIQASGFAGTTGQSFLNHVAGALSGWSLASWILDSISIVGTDFNPATVYSNNAEVYFDFDFVGQAKFPYIRRPFSEYFSIINSGAPDPGTKNAEIIGGTYPDVGFLSGNRVNVRLKAGSNFYAPAVTGPVYNYFHDLNGEPWEGLAGYDPAIPGFDLDQLWRIELALSGPPSQTTSGFTFDLWYPTDPGAFNPARQIGTQQTVTMNDIMLAQSVSWRWWEDSSHTVQLLDYEGNPVVSEAAIFYTGPSYTTGGTVYPQYQYGGSGSWFDYPSNNAGITWDDPRF